MGEIMFILLLVCVALNVVILTRLNSKKGELKMVNESIQQLKTKVEELTTAAKEREERDILQDTATKEQIRLLTEQVAALTAIIESGTLSAEDKETLDQSVIALQATIDSLKSADPIPPVIP